MVLYCWESLIEHGFLENSDRKIFSFRTIQGFNSIHITTIELFVNNIILSLEVKDVSFTKVNDFLRGFAFVSIFCCVLTHINHDHNVVEVIREPIIMQHNFGFIFEAERVWVIT